MPRNLVEISFLAMASCREIYSCFPVIWMLEVLATVDSEILKEYVIIDVMMMKKMKVDILIRSKVDFILLTPVLSKIRIIFL